MSKLGRNIAYNFLYQFLILALPLVTAPYLARVIGAEGVGTYSYAYSVATYFVYFVKLGLDNYGNRAIAGCQGDRGERTRAFWSIYAMQVACFVVVGAAYLLYSFLLADDLAVALFSGLYVLSSLFDVNWFFFGMEQFGLTVARNTVIKLGTTALIFLLVRDAGDVDLYIAIMCGGYLASQLALWPFLRRYIGFYRPRLSDVLPHVKPNATLFVSVIAVSVYNVLSKILLGNFASTEAVGYFESAAKIISVPTALINAVGTVMLPRTSSLVAQGRTEEASAHTDLTLRVVMAFTSVAAFGLPAIAYPFCEIFYGPGYDEAAACMVVLSATIPLLGFGNVIRTQYLIPNGRDAVFVRSAIAGAVASLTVSVLADPVLGSIGASLASVAAETAVLLFQVAGVRHEIPLGRYLSYAVVPLACGAVMSLALTFLPEIKGTWAQMLVTMGAGFAVYIPLCLIGMWALGRVHKRRMGRG